MIATLTSAKGRCVRVGKNEPVRVMALVGLTTSKDERAQKEKVAALLGMADGPDVIADLSLVTTAKPLYMDIISSGCLAAMLPIYLARVRHGRVDAQELLDVATGAMEAGVSLLTIHPTATHALVEQAQQKRHVPWTSRGGGLVIRDLITSERRENIYSMILPELLAVARKHRVVISLGATFRAATVFDSMDSVQLAEIEAQRQLATEIAAAGVHVIIESPGHAPPEKIRVLGKILSKVGFPIMPLGPMPTDSAVGFDHVAAAIGASLLGLEGAAHMLAAVTREEHTGGIPSTASTLEAVQSARVAARVIDLGGGYIEPEQTSLQHRTKHSTCVAGQATPGCSRCGRACPLLHHHAAKKSSPPS